MLNARDSANTCRKKLSYERVFTILTDVEMTMIRCELKGCERHMMDFIRLKDLMNVRHTLKYSQLDVTGLNSLYLLMQ